MNIMNHTDELDEKLNSISMGWKTSRMNRVDLTVLRLAVYELEYEKEEVPVGVAINEAVELAKCFGSEESGAFVNGILGKIANRIRRLLQERHLLRKKNRPLQAEIRFQGKGSFQKGGSCQPQCKLQGTGNKNE